MGMSYLHIPVDFANPTLEDAQTFFGLMRGLKTRKVWVHCRKCARFGFFVSLSAIRAGLSDKDATGPILKAWTPQMDDVWKGFLQLTKEQIG